LEHLIFRFLFETARDSFFLSGHLVVTGGPPVLIAGCPLNGACEYYSWSIAQQYSTGTASARRSFLSNPHLSSSHPANSTLFCRKQTQKKKPYEQTQQQVRLSAIPASVPIFFMRT
jgi:hypothetical protein